MREATRKDNRAALISQDIISNSCYQPSAEPSKKAVSKEVEIYKSDKCIVSKLLVCYEFCKRNCEYLDVILNNVVNMVKEYSNSDKELKVLERTKESVDMK